MPRKKARNSVSHAPGATPPSLSSKRKFNWRESNLRWSLAAGGLLLITLLAYSNSFRAGLTRDSWPMILQNPKVHEANFSNVQFILGHTYWWPSQFGLYRPITTLSYLVNYALLGNGERPAGYHWINFLLHFINVLLVFALSTRLLRSFWAGLSVAAIWTMHPILTESVTNVIGRADLLAGIGVLGGFSLYLKSTESRGAARIAFLLALAAITALGVFSKENAVVILGVVILYEASFWRERRNLRGLAWGCIAISIPIALMLYQRSVVLASYPALPAQFLDNPLAGSPFLAGRLTAIAVMGKYIWLLVWPITLSADYSYNQIPLENGSIHNWIAWAAIAAIIFAAAILWKRNRTAFFFTAFAFVTFIPTSNLLFYVGTIMAERFLYLPAIGFAACLTLAIRALSERARAPLIWPVAIALIIAAWGIRTYVRNNDWRDDLTLAKASVKTSPNSYRTHMGLALWLGRTEPVRTHIDEAAAEAEEGLSILKGVPDERNTTTSYGIAASVYQLKGVLASAPGYSDPPEAARDYQRALDILLQAVRIDEKLNETHGEIGIPDGITESRVKPMSSPQIYIQLATVYLKLKEFDKAYRTALYARALSIRSEEASLLAAEAAATAGRKDEAAVAMVAGLLITGDKRFLPPLNALNGNGLDSKGCVFKTAANGALLNNSCEPVHGDICSAFADIIEIDRWNLDPDVADQTKSRARVEFGCTEQSLEQGRKIEEFPLP